MTQYPVRNLDEVALKMIWVIVCRANQIWRILPNDVVVHIHELYPEHGEEKQFVPDRLQ